MAVEVSRVAPFGPGSKGYRFEVHRDEKMDRKVYEAGRILEKARFRKGSLGQRMFERLSLDSESAKTSPKR
jgi:hypothetical protein